MIAPKYIINFDSSCKDFSYLGKLDYTRFLLKKAIESNPDPYKAISINRDYEIDGFKQEIKFRQTLRTSINGENFFRVLNHELGYNDIKACLDDLNEYYYVALEDGYTLRLLVVPEETYIKYPDYYSFRESPEYRLYRELCSL